MSETFTVRDVARAARGEIVGPFGAPDAGRPVLGATLDSRRIAAQQAFVPLPGARTDGHAFVRGAFAAGASTSLCARARRAEVVDGWADERGGLATDTPLVLVDDPLTALRGWAAARRAAWTGELVALTGSNGKTTTKEMLAAILARRAPTGKTEGNLNNQLGVPVTLTRLAAHERYAVVEIGMNHPGEVRDLAMLARPTAAVITSIAPEHLEGLGSLAQVARAEAEVAEALPTRAPLVLPADEPLLLDATRGLPVRRITFGFTPGADIAAENVESLGEQGMRFDVAGFPRLAIPVPGRHSVSNALAAIALARALGLTPDECKDGLARMTPPPGRMQVAHWGGVTVLLDHYNANPGSMAAALDTLRDWPGAGRRWAALGDMLELGDAAAAFHAELGPRLGALDGALLWGPLMRSAHAAAQAAGAGARVRHFDDRATLGRALAELARPGDVVMVKGSRGSAMEQAAAELERALGAGDAQRTGEGR